MNGAPDCKHHECYTEEKRDVEKVEEKRHNEMMGALFGMLNEMKAEGEESNRRH
jgi:hypothetical protein